MSIVRTLYKEIRSSMATPEKWLTEWFNGGVESKTGVMVNERSALNYSAVYCATRILADTLMQIPLLIYKREKNNGRSVADKHPFYPILHRRVNSGMTSARFRQTLQGHLTLWGMAYAYIERTVGGKIIGLKPIRPDLMHIEVHEKELVYEYHPLHGAPQKIPRNELLVIPGFGFDGIRGYSVVSLARESIGLGLATEEFGARFFANGAHMGGIIEHPALLGPDAAQHLEKSVNEMHQGLGKSHQLMVIEEGAKYNPISIPPEDAQFLQTRQFQTVEIARWFNVPVHMLKDLERATFTNIEHMGIEFVTYTMGPWLTLWETELEVQLLTEREQEDYYVEFNVSGLLRGDTKTRYEAYKMGRDAGFLSINDIRQKENMTVIPGGDNNLEPLNMVPVGTKLENKERLLRALVGNETRVIQGELTDTTNVSNDNLAATTNVREEKRGQIGDGRRRLAERYQPLFTDAAGRIVRKEVNDIRRAARKNLGSRSAGELGKWLESYYTEIRDYLQKNLRPVIMTCAKAISDETYNEIGTTGIFGPELEIFIEGVLNRMTDEHIGSSTGQINQLANDPDSEDPLAAIEQRLDEWEEKRPEKMGRELSTTTMNAIAGEVILNEGYDLKWQIAGDTTCPYCKTLSGKTVGREGYFVNAGDSLNPTGTETIMNFFQSKKHPPLHDGCDCIITAG